MNASSANPQDGGRTPEVRHLTFLKCDIVDSTQLANELDFDEQRDLSRVFHETVTSSAARHGGHIMWFEGDAALIAFGHPEPREDAAESALRMGLELADAVHRIAVVPGVVLELRIGVASGRVSVADAVDRESVTEGAVHGPILSMAERLRSRAEPGTVVIADSTQRLAARFFEYEDLGIAQAKGFGEGLRAWRVLRESAVASRFEAQRFDPALGEIVGRGEALDRLDAAWAAALQGRGGAVALVGEAGIGKSRLARALLARAAGDAAVTLEVNCTPSTGNSPLYPVGVLLRRTAQIEPEHSDAEREERARRLLERFLGPDERADALTYLAPMFGLRSAPIPSHQTPDEVRNQTITTVVGILRALTSQSPLALLCEDLHWADATTAEVVQRMAGEAANLRVLLLVTVRSLSDVQIDTQRFAVIDLLPLDDRTATDLVRSLGERARLSEDLIGNIVARGEGVPLFLEEITRNAIEAAQSDGTGATAVAAVPTTLQLVTQARLGRWPQLKRIVQTAAVLGREFSLRVLEQMLPERRAEVAPAITLLAAHGMFAPPDRRDADRAQFKHALIRDTVYQTLLRSDRQSLHSRAADVLIAEAQGAPQGIRDMLALHLVEARRFVEAIHNRLAAASETAARGGFAESVGHCEAALGLIDKVEDPSERQALHFKLLVQHAVALAGKSGYAALEVEEAYLRAHELCDESVSAAMRYPIVRGLAAVHLVGGHLAAADDFSIRGLELAEQSGDPSCRIDALSMRIYTTLYHGRLADCRSLIDQCLKLYREEDGSRFAYPVPHDAATAVLSVLPTVAWLLGDAKGCEQAIAEGLAHVEHLARPFDKAMYHAWTAGTRYTQRRYMEAAQSAMLAYEIASQRLFRDWLATGGMLALLSQLALQPSAEAAAQARYACQGFDAARVGLNASYYRWGVARGLLNLHDWEGAGAMIAEAFERAKASGESRMDAELLMLQAELPEFRERAGELLGKALQLAEEQGAVATALRAAIALASLQGEASPAARVAAAARAELEGTTSFPDEPGWMERHLGAVKSALRAAHERSVS